MVSKFTQTKTKDKNYIMIPKGQFLRMKTSVHGNFTLTIKIWDFHGWVWNFSRILLSFLGFRNCLLCRLDIFDHLANSFTDNFMSSGLVIWRKYMSYLHLLILGFTLFARRRPVVHSFYLNLHIPFIVYSFTTLQHNNI